MQVFLSFIFLSSLISCNSNQSAKNILPAIADSKINPHANESIIDTLIKLDFVKKSDENLRRKYKHGLSFIMDSVQDKENDIFVKAGFSSDIRFETYYQFYVNSNTSAIRVYDPISDKKLSLKEYRNKKK